MTHYRRSSPTTRERVSIDLASLGVATGVAAVVFYLTRLLLSREALDPPPAKAGGAEELPAATAPPKRSMDSRTSA